MRAPSDLEMLAATAVAVEHVLWAAGEGLDPRRVLADAGIDWPEHSWPTWHDCVRGLSIVWRRLGTPAAKAPVPLLRRVA